MRLFKWPMGVNLKKLCVQCFKSRLYSTKVETDRNTFTCKLLIVGGGAGGCSIAWRLSKHLNTNEIIVLEPSKVHYYQPLFTLIAAGIKKFPECHKPTLSLLPSNVALLRDKVSEFDPDYNVVYTECGNRVVYQYLVIAVGLVNDYDQIPGLKAALDSDSPATTIFAPQHCVKTWHLIKEFTGGHAVFTYPCRGGKCSGAAQKIMYLAHDFWKRKKILNHTNITYLTGSGAIFGVPKYATALTKIAAEKDIALNTGLELVEITKKSACFVDVSGNLVNFPYKFLHVAPPMCPPACLTNSKELADCTGYLDVDEYSLQHKKYDNVYGLGDCTSTPNSKTAAAVAVQSAVVASNLLSTMQGRQPTAKYSGYGACPLLTSYKGGILAEFSYGKKVCETFPFDQSKERRVVYYLNKHIFPFIYWNKLIKGTWNGPSTIRKIINPLKK